MKHTREYRNSGRARTPAELSQGLRLVRYGQTRRKFLGLIIPVNTRRKLRGERKKIKNRPRRIAKVGGGGDVEKEQYHLPNKQQAHVFECVRDVNN